MRIEISVPAEFVDDSGAPIASAQGGRAAALMRGPDQHLSLADHLEEDLAEVGVVGGRISGWLEPGSGHVDVTFWAPRALNADECAALLRDVSAQMADGVGEGGLEFQLPGRQAIAIVSEDVDDYVLRQEVDDVVVPSPSRVGIYSWKGDLDAVRAAVARGESVEGRYLGYRALELAIKRAHVEVALWLLQSGAAVDYAGIHQWGPLHLCAASRDLSDEASVKLAQALVARGAAVHALDDTGCVAADIANGRGKIALEAFLRGVPAEGE